MTHKTAILTDNALAEGTPVVIVRGKPPYMIGSISGPLRTRKTYDVFVPHLPGVGPYMAWGIPAEHVRSLDTMGL